MVLDWTFTCGVIKLCWVIFSGGLKEVIFLKEDIRKNDSLKFYVMQFGHFRSVGSMLAIDRPYIASSVDYATELCLEYGSATQLYLVPRIEHEEHVRCMHFLYDIMFSIILTPSSRSGLCIIDTKPIS